MWLSEGGIGSKAALDKAGDGARSDAVCAHLASAGTLSSEAPVSRKRRREIDFELKLGFPCFGNSGLLLISRSWGFGGGFLFERHLALGIGLAAGAGVCCG
jgi:hypothetical protein